MNSEELKILVVRLTHDIHELILGRATMGTAAFADLYVRCIKKVLPPLALIRFSRARQRVSRSLALLLTCMAVNAGARDLEQAHAMTAVPCAKEPIYHSSSGYTTELVDACLGPNRYQIPINYFGDQKGPNSTGYFTLSVQWPELRPSAPGQYCDLGMKPVGTKDFEICATQIRFRPIYTALPMQGLMEGQIHPSVREKGSLSELPPSARMDTRDKQPGQFGLIPYFVNRTSLLAYSKLFEERNGFPYRGSLESQEDWYLSRNAEGALTTFIECDSHLRSPDYVIEGGRLLDTGAPEVLKCTQKFAIPEEGIYITIEYVRALLKDWKRFEDRARELLMQFRVR